MAKLTFSCHKCSFKLILVSYNKKESKIHTPVIIEFIKYDVKKNKMLGITHI